MKPIDSISYQVYFENSLQEFSSFLTKHQSKYSKVFVLTDTNTTEYCLPVLQPYIPNEIAYDLIEIEAGEENKTIDFCIGVWRTLLDFGADRKALMVNLGGGVVTDMGAFAASTYKRGIDFVQIPTTLLSQVDASVGGKTGVDIANVKNIVGTFAQPQAVFINDVFLNTLPEREQRSGFAEMIKHGLIFDAKYFNDIMSTDFLEVTNDMVYHSVQIKNTVVTQDPTEKGLRKILNFGHTIGHAVESYYLDRGDERLLHGEAIAIGMLAEAYLSHLLLGLSEEELHQIKDYLLRVYPKPELTDYDTLLELMLNDKKNQIGKIGFALLKSIGKCDFDCYVTKDDIQKSLDWVNSIQFNSIQYK